MQHITRVLLIFGFSFSCLAAFNSQADALYKGVNLSGAEYGNCAKKDVVYGAQYTYPSTTLMDTFLVQGINAFRLPFCWERLQPEPKGIFNTSEFERLDKTVKYLTGKNAYAVLDPHNYAVYSGQRIGSGLGNDVLADLWSKLATRYQSDPHVIFALMNEPYGLPGETWVQAVNAAIAAIRKTGAKNLIVVPGVAWTGAHSWSTSASYGTPNAVTMLNVVDPANNYVYDAHQYLDLDSSGTNSSCVSANIGAERLAVMSSWLRLNKRKAFLTEFGAANNALCLAGLQQMLAYLNQNSDIWIGWTYWSAGDWQGSYMFNLAVNNDPSAPNQWQVLRPFLAKNLQCDAASSNCVPSAPAVKEILPE